MACGAAQSLEQMVAFRFRQGIFAAFIGPLSQSVMLDINPPERHARAMSIWGMGIMIGPILGPVLGGWLTESVNWRWVFYVNLPVGLLTLAMMRSEEHTSELQSLMRISYAVFCLKKKKPQEKKPEI